MTAAERASSPLANASLARSSDAAADATLENTWRDPPGLIGWLSSINHKSISRRFIVTTLGFFVAGGILAMLMRLQLARPENKLIGPDFYNQLFSMHGTTMMFLFAVPVMQAVAIYLLPLMLGTRSVAFPRMNAFAYWVFLFGGLMLYGAFILDVGPDAGWFSYVPLAGPDFSPGKRVDFWAQLVTFTQRPTLPRPTIWPFIGAITVTVMFIGSIFTPWALVWGSVPVAIALTAWFWPSKGEADESRSIEVKP
jgi:hypothetical protein